MPSNVAFRRLACMTIQQQSMSQRFQLPVLAERDLCVRAPCRLAATGKPVRGGPERQLGYETNPQLIRAALFAFPAPH
jgi:hypothetical protein